MTPEEQARRHRVYAAARADDIDYVDVIGDELVLDGRFSAGQLRRLAHALDGVDPAAAERERCRLQCVFREAMAAGYDATQLALIRQVCRRIERNIAEGLG